MRAATACALGSGLVLSTVAVGCVTGTESADLLVVERDGTVPGARLTLRLQDGAEATCNGTERGTLTSEQLIDARAIVRALKGDPEEDEPGLLQTKPDLPPRPGSVFRFRVRFEDGVVRFADNSAGQPEEYARLAKLTRDVARGACGLDR